MANLYHKMNDQEIKERTEEMLLEFLERVTSGENVCSEIEIEIVPDVARILCHSEGEV